MFLALTLAVTLAGIAPASGVTAADRPNDGGSTIQVTWTRSPDEGIIGYRVLRRADGAVEWDTLTMVGRFIARYNDQAAEDGTRYQYAVLAVSDTAAAVSEPSAWAASKPQWYNSERTTALIGSLIFTFLIVFFTFQARSGRKLFIRRIGGLDAVEEALGRATEMGRPILYVPGLSSIADVATIAALNILGEVAKKTAKFGTPLIVPNRDPIVYTVAREVVKEAYTSAGRPDAFNPDMVFYVTDQQFAYAAAVDGIMVREKPATNFLMGMFWAESLILAETGASTGAVQIAGTDAIGQLPFFITACDYTLIGEELYAASAYLSHEPLLLGAIKGQDWSKLLILGLIIIGTILQLTAGVPVIDIF
ncbi:fibronectin type III domain-containing protein [candidate division WOR-3 bacterium]|nr:fibronectin type III domain-containing protein [candidate division WOR-3 bacterium]